MATLALSMAPCLSGMRNLRSSPPMALLAGSSVRTSGISLRTSSTSRPALLTSSFMPSSSSLSTSFAGLSLGFNLSSSIGVGSDRCRRLVVRAAKYQLCQTKRNRSRKSLARTHGFRRRMRTTSGRALLKRRRDKGRKILCTKSSPSAGKRVLIR